MDGEQVGGELLLLERTDALMKKGLRPFASSLMAEHLPSHLERTDALMKKGLRRCPGCPGCRLNEPMP
jgi:hypothetical protein